MLSWSPDDLLLVVMFNNGCLVVFNRLGEALPID